MCAGIVIEQETIQKALIGHLYHSDFQKKQNKKTLYAFWPIGIITKYYHLLNICQVEAMVQVDSNFLNIFILFLIGIFKTINYSRGRV